MRVRDTFLACYKKPSLRWLLVDWPRRVVKKAGFSDLLLQGRLKFVAVGVAAKLVMGEHCLLEFSMAQLIDKL